MVTGGRLAASVVVLVLLAPTTVLAASKARKQSNLASRVRELERQNAELQRRLQRLENAAASSAPAEGGEAHAAGPSGAPAAQTSVTTSEVAPSASAGAPAAHPEIATDSSEEVGLGLIARYGTVRASFQVFGDAGFGWANPSEHDTSNASFAIGALDLFSAVQIGEHFQALSETVLEGDTDTNEVNIDLERLWAAWTIDDALYLKIGREHSPQSRWDRRYHHGKWL